MLTVRKKPKANGLATSGSTSIPTRPKPKTPRRRTRRANENFDGKLSHTSPISPHSKITKYFHPQEDVSCFTFSYFVIENSIFYGPISIKMQ